MKTSIAMLSFVVASICQAQTTTPWHISGSLSEVCSCGVPCTCNFGQFPDKSYCYAIVGMTVEHGTYGSTKLDSLHFAGAQGAKGFAFYVDATATPEQKEGLTQILRQMWWKALLANGVKSKKDIPSGFAFLGVKPAKITHEVTSKGNKYVINGAGGFETAFLMGFDGKTPIVVENNTTFNIPKSTKGKSKHLEYSDAYGNKFKFAGTNGNDGHFDWTDSTPVYFK